MTTLEAQHPETVLLLLLRASRRAICRLEAAEILSHKRKKEKNRCELSAFLERWSVTGRAKWS